MHIMLLAFFIIYCLSSAYAEDITLLWGYQYTSYEISNHAVLFQKTFIKNGKIVFNNQCTSYDNNPQLCQSHCENGFWNINGVCTGCTEEPITEATEQECHKCIGRYFDDNKCIYPCPQNSFNVRLSELGFVMVCTPCNHPQALPIWPNTHQQCKHNRFVFNNLSVYYCPGGFYNTALRCMTCDDVWDWATEQNKDPYLDLVYPENCLACPNRVLVDGKCILKKEN